MYTATKRRVGGLVRDFRIAAGITQKELARRVDVKQGTLSKIESGQIGLSVADLRRFCDALGITVQDFVSRVDALPSEGSHAG